MAFLRALVLLLLVMGSTAHAAGSDDHVIERAFLEDASRALSIDDVVGRDFAPSGAILARGYTDSAHWLRLKVRSAGGEPLILRIRPTFLDEVVLYEPDPDRPGAWIRKVTGDRVPFMEREVSSVALGFVIRPVEPETTYYLRLTTTSTSLLHVEAVGEKVAGLRDLRIHITQIVCLGFLLWILLWTANDFVLRRDPVVGWFAVNQLFFMSYDVLVMGYGALIFPSAPPGFVDKLMSVVVITTPLFSLFTNRVLIRQFAPYRFAMIVLDGLILMNAVALVLLIAGETRQGLEINALVILLIAPALPIFAFGTRREALPGKRTLRVVYCVQTVTLLMTMAPLLGLVPATTWNLNAAVIHGLLSDLPMFLLLQLRSRKAQRNGIEAQINLGLTQRELELERKQLDMQSRFMSMLTHELRTPLSVARMAVGMAKVEGEPRRLAENALDNMDAIIERCTYADRMEQQLLEVQARPINVASILQAATERSATPHRLKITAAPLPPLAADEQLVGVVLNNLIENALKYSPDGAVIDVTAAPAEQAGAPGVLIAVENPPGRAGLPDPDRIFEKFYRNPRAHMKSGSGLGLYIVQGIAGLLKGRVAYELVEGKVRFSLWLPC